jgi:ketosteroid isomerase-like protein
MPADDIAEVLAVEAERYGAMCAGDSAALAGILHEDLGYVHSDGTTDTRSSYLAGVEGKRWDYQSIVARDQHVRLIGDTALLQGRVNISVIIEGTPARFEVMMLTVLTRVAGRWQVIHSQGTRLATA